MIVVDYILIAAGILAAIYAAVRTVRAGRTYMAFRGKRLVSCPETHQPAAVRVAAGAAAANTILGNPGIALKECSRWPQRQDCPQDCLAQIEEAPQACLVWNIMNRWYEGRDCVYCGKPFGEIHWHDHPPALLSKEGKTIQWNAIAPENLQAALATHKAVCWSCHMAESFRREHPDLVLERTATPLRSSLYH